MTFQTEKLKFANRTKESVWTIALSEVTALIRQIRSGYGTRTRFERLHEMLQALPMSRQKFALLSRRSHNAEAYHSRGEKGATLFELNLVLGHLKHLGYV